MEFRGYYTVDDEMYHIEPEAASVTGRHLIYREFDSRLPAGKCGKLNNAFVTYAFIAAGVKYRSGV